MSKEKTIPISTLKTAWENHGRLKPTSSGLNKSTISFSSEKSKFNKS